MINLLKKLRSKFEWLESQDLRVGLLYLNSEEIIELEKSDQIHYDRIKCSTLLKTGRRGTLWGAAVFESDIVPEGHICILPDGLEVKLIDSAACMVL